MPAKFLPSSDGAVPRTPILTRERLDDLERILDRRIARHRRERLAEIERVLARRASPLDETARGARTPARWLALLDGEGGR